MRSDLEDETRTVSLREVAELNPESTRGLAADSEIHYIDISSIDSSYHIDDAVSQLRFGDAPSRAKRVVRKDDILVSTVRTERRAFALVPAEHDGYVASTGFCVIRARPDVVDPGFLWGVVRTNDFVGQLVARQRGSNYPAVSAKDVGEVLLRLPSMATQRRVAGVLGSLDGTVDNNRRIAKTLEGIAATLFKGRFVDFVDRDDLLESEIGPIPRGWSVATIADVGGVHRDLTDGASGLPYIGLDRMPKGSTVLTDWQTDDAPGGQSARFAEGDILFGKLRPYFRKVGVAPIDGRCSTEILVLRPNDVAYHGFLLGHVSSQRFIDHCVAISRGTRMPRSEWKDAGTFPIAVPPRDVAAEFDAASKAMYGRILASVRQLRTAASLRDTLLSRLVSGDLRVPSIDEAVLA